MKTPLRLVLAAGVAIGVSGWIAPAFASADPAGHGADDAVFVMTDNPAGNQVVAFARANDGSLSPAGTYNTGGVGGQLNGSQVDHEASQGALALDEAHGLLYAVNPGSNTISVFAVSGDQLSLHQVLGSGGTFPVSVAVRGDLVYVLNGISASLSGYRVAGGRLHPIEGSVRSLGFTVPSGGTQYVSTPGQVAFSPQGSQLVVTTKASGNDIDVFSVRADGRLSPAPVVNNEAANPVPFAVSFDAGGLLVVANAGNNSLATYTLNSDGTVSLIDSVGTGQTATCWVTTAQGRFYASNAGSANLSGFSETSAGTLTLLSPPTATDPGTVDAAASPGGQYLYVQTGGNGNVDEFQVNSDGSLTAIGSVPVVGAAGGEGIVAS